MQNYLINYFYWWYFILGGRLVRTAIARAIFLLEITNTLPMAQNLTTPMFQDKSGIGKAISFIVRLIWVWFGGIFSLIMIVPIVLVTVAFFLLLPAITLLIIRNLIDIL